MDFERKRAEDWVRDLRENFNWEKTQLEERVQSLEKALERPRGKSDGGVVSASDTHAPPTTAESAPSDGGASTVVTTGGGDAPPPGDGSTTETTSHTDTPGHTVPATETDGETGHSALLEKVTQLLKAQTEAMTAQAQAAAVQHLPAFHCYTGEDDQTDNEVFDRWLERFEERAKLAGWNKEQKLYQLKLHLDLTALQVFRMLPEAERTSYDEAIKALKKRFRPVDIEELRGLEFHTRVQGDESIEKLGINIQKLGHKAFPTMKGKEFDRIKGRFFQALHVKWQRKLEAPRPTESFNELYDRARMLERHEKQYAASAAARGDTRSTGKKDDHSQQKQPGASRNSKPQTAKGQNEPKPAIEQPSKPFSTQKRAFHGICHRCQQYGHLARNCPGPLSGKNAQEARGRSAAGTTSRTSTVESNLKPDELTEEQLEDLLSQRRLQREQALLSDGTSTASSVTASEKDSRAVGPTVYIDLLFNGEPVRAMVDTGAQSTIISRSMLHAIGRRAKSEGCPLPVLEQPSVRLFGKDGKGGRELTITAELQVTLEADCKSTCVSVFVQPNSEQKCLLGMNAIPSLGISVLRANGEPLIAASEPTSPKVANVCLAQSTTIPSQKGRFVKAHIDCSLSQGDHLLFEPRHSTLESLGLNTQESLLTLHSDGMVLIPVENFQGVSVVLEKGAQLGVAKRYEPDVVAARESTLIEGECATVTASPDHNTERYEQLSKAFKSPGK